MPDDRTGNEAVAESRDPREDFYLPRRNDSKFEKRPWTAYFYYIAKTSNGYALPVRYNYYSYHERIKRDDLDELIECLTHNARRQPADQEIKPSDINEEWRKKSYIIFAIDDPNYEFEKPGIVLDPSSGKPNHTFYDAKNFNGIPVKIPGTEQHSKVSAIAILNHMKRGWDEEDLMTGDLPQKFYFQFLPPIRFPFLPDDGGTNLGPPVPPPA